MTERAGLDPTVLEDDLAFHQIVSFTLSPPPLADPLERSSLFRVRRFRHRTEAEWARWSAEHEPSPFPLGRVTTWSDGVLLEAFSDKRIRELRHRVDLASSWKVSPDEKRIFQLHDMLEEPIPIFRPPRESAGGETARDAAALWLRMAWAFLPREDLGGRTPASALATGRGRARVAALLAGLPAELRAADPRFPAFSVDELRPILLPEAPTPTEAPEEHPHSARSQPRH